MTSLDTELSTDRLPSSQFPYHDHHPLTTVAVQAPPCHALSCLHADCSLGPWTICKCSCLHLQMVWERARERPWMTLTEEILGFDPMSYLYIGWGMPTCLLVGLGILFGEQQFLQIKARHKGKSNPHLQNLVGSYYIFRNPDK